MIPGGLTSSIYAGRLTLALVFAANASNVNLATQAAALGWNGISPVTLRVTINSGVILSATTTANYALDETGLPDGSVVYIENNGKINGKGGNGGAGGFNTGNASPGSIGGNAFKATVTTYFDNLNGEVNAGSGGNGGSAATRTVYASGVYQCCSPKTKFFLCSNNTGATGSVGGSLGATGSTGGSGANATQLLANGCILCTPSYSNYGTCTRGSPGAGGLPGKYVFGDSFVTWVNNGTRRGGVA